MTSPTRAAFLATWDSDFKWLAYSRMAVMMNI